MGGPVLGGTTGADWAVGESLGGTEVLGILTTSSYNSSGPSSGWAFLEE